MHEEVRKRASIWIVPAALALSALLTFAVNFGTSPPAAQGVDVQGFSSARAEALLREFLGDETPHPVASPANRRVKERILQQLERFGISAEVQQSFACNIKWPRCAQVENIIANIPGQNTEAVLLMAHYDSVPHAPGAGDDGAGVAAILEVARQLKQEGPYRNSLILAITDAEEVGLIGAEAFFDQHPAAKDVALVLNLEGSGSAGPVQLLRTGRDNRFVVQRYQAVVTDSMANSVSNEIFKHMPNDTDFSVVQRAGIQGIDLVFAGERNHYHTRLDSVDNLDKNTLQHHGNLLLPLAREFLQADLLNTPGGDVVYLDLYGNWLLQWGEEWTLWLCALAGILLTIAVRRRSSGVALAQSSAWLVLGIALIGAGLALLFWLLGLLVELPAWPAMQWPLFGLLLCLTVSLGLRLPCGKDYWALAFANIVLWLLLSVMTALYAPGAAPLFVLPLLQMSVLALLASLLTDTARLRSIVAVLLLLLITPTTVGLAPLLLETQGYKLVMVVFPFMALFGAMLLSLKSASDPGMTRTVSRVSALLALALFAVVSLMDLYSDWRPQGIVLSYLEDRTTGSANWMARSPEAIPGKLKDAGNLIDSDSPIMPYLGTNPGPVATAEITDSLAPTLTVVADSWQDGQRTVNLQLKSQRNARHLTLRIASDSGLIAATANDVNLQLRDFGYDSAQLGKHYGITTFTSAPYGVLINLQFDNPDEKLLYFSDSTTQLPESGRALIDARNVLGVPTHRGDQWVIQDQLLLESTGLVPGL